MHSYKDCQVCNLIDIKGKMQSETLYMRALFHLKYSSAAGAAVITVYKNANGVLQVGAQVSAWSLTQLSVSGFT